MTVSNWNGNCHWCWCRCRGFDFMKREALKSKRKVSFDGTQRATGSGRSKSDPRTQSSKPSPIKAHGYMAICIWQLSPVRCPLLARKCQYHQLQTAQPLPDANPFITFLFFSFLWFLLVAQPPPPDYPNAKLDFEKLAFMFMFKFRFFPPGSR